MSLSKLSLKYVQGQWDRRQRNPLVRDWADRGLVQINVITGDNVLVTLHSQEELIAGTTTDLDLTEATALHCVIRAEQDPDSVLYGYQSVYNNGDYVAGEVLSEGKVTWKISIGSISYSITGVSTGGKYFEIDDNYVSQFIDGDTLIISGSTGNDNTYTINGTPTYQSGTNRTRIVVTETISDATVDGNLIHSALQNATYINGYLDAFIECSWVNSASDPQTLLPAFMCRIHAQLDEGNTGVDTSAAPTYATLTEVATSYVAKVDYINPVTLSVNTTLTEREGIQLIFVDTAAVQITLPAMTGTKYWPHIINTSSGDITVIGTINGIVGPHTIVGVNSVNPSPGCLAPVWNGSAWIIFDSLTV